MTVDQNSDGSMDVRRLGPLESVLIKIAIAVVIAGIPALLGGVLLMWRDNAVLTAQVVELKVQVNHLSERIYALETRKP